MKNRPEELQGGTQRVLLPNGSPMFVTVNYFEGRPTEVFVRYDDPALCEWISALTILITRLLRAGEKLEDIAEELSQIAGPESGHHVPGTHDWSPSLVARVGRAFGNFFQQPGDASMRIFP